MVKYTLGLFWRINQDKGTATFSGSFSQEYLYINMWEMRADEHSLDSIWTKPWERDEITRMWWHFELIQLFLCTWSHWNPYNSLHQARCYYPHFTDKETDAWMDQTSGPGERKWEQGFKLRSVLLQNQFLVTEQLMDSSSQRPVWCACTLVHAGPGLSFQKLL